MKQPKSIQISIPTPCHEDWSKMSPQEQGRFCNSCQKCVVDFTGFTDEQLIHYLATHAEKNLCGRFNDTQLNRKIFTPPSRRYYFQWIMNLAIVMFLTNLLGINAKAQDPVNKEWKQDDKKTQCRDTTKLTAEELDKLPTRSTTSMVTTSVGGFSVTSDSNSISIGEGRADGILYIDSVLIQGNSKTNNTLNGIDIIVTPQPGTPAKYSNKELEK